MPWRRRGSSPWCTRRATGGPRVRDTGSGDRSGQLLARPLPDGVRELRGLPEGQLQRLQRVAQRAGVERTQIRCEGTTSPARALINFRASSRSVAASPSSPRPHLTAAALIRCSATVVITSTAGTSPMSRTRRRRVEATRRAGRVVGVHRDSWEPQSSCYPVMDDRSAHVHPKGVGGEEGSRTPTRTSPRESGSTGRSCSGRCCAGVSRPCHVPVAVLRRLPCVRAGPSRARRWHTDVEKEHHISRAPDQRPDPRP